MSELKVGDTVVHNVTGEVGVVLAYCKYRGKLEWQILVKAGDGREFTAPEYNWTLYYEPNNLIQKKGCALNKVIESLGLTRREISDVPICHEILRELDNTIDLVIMFNEPVITKPKIIKGVKNYGYHEISALFWFEKNGHNNYIPYKNVKFFGRRMDFELAEPKQCMVTEL